VNDVLGELAADQVLSEQELGSRPHRVVSNSNARKSRGVMRSSGTHHLPVTHGRANLRPLAGVGDLLGTKEDVSQLDPRGQVLSCYPGQVCVQAVAKLAAATSVICCGATRSHVRAGIKSAAFMLAIERGAALLGQSKPVNEKVRRYAFRSAETGPRLAEVCRP